MNSGNYKIILSSKAVKDSKLIIKQNLHEKVKTMLREIENNPYDKTYHFEHLKYDLKGLCSKRINYKHRLVYEVNEKTKTVIVHRMWSHYEKL